MSFGITLGPPRIDFSQLSQIGKTISDGVDGIIKDKQEREVPGIFSDLVAARAGGADPFASAFQQSAAPKAVAGTAEAPSVAAAPTFASTSGSIADYLAQTRARESGGNDLAANPNSTAKGRYQFTDQTWAGVAKRHPDLGLQPGGWRDPGQQEKAMQAFTGDNAKALTAAGLPINPANLYGSHFLGEAGGPKFIAGALQNPDQPATALVSPGAAMANRSVFFGQGGRPKTAGEVYAWLGGAKPSAAPAATPTLSGAVASAEPDAANMPTPDSQPAGFVIPGAEGQAAPASAAGNPGFAGFGNGGAASSPEMRAALAAAWRNPNTRALATSILSQMLSGKTKSWELKDVNGQSSWVNSDNGRILPIGERKVEATSEQKNFEQSLKDPRFQAHLDAQRRPLTPTIVSPGQAVLPPGEYGVPSFVSPPKVEPYTLSPGQQRMEGDKVVASVPDRDKSNEGEAKLRGEFSKQLGSFTDVQDAYGRVISAVQGRSDDPANVSPASDIGLVFGFMKMLDPGSVVREGEYATAKNATGVPERVMNEYNRLLKGEFLAPEQRQDFVATAGRLYGQARQQAEQTAGRYRDLAKGQGLDEGRVVALPNAPTAPEVVKRAPAGTTPDATNPPKLGSVKIPMGAVGALRTDPAMREQFDAKYGKGASDRVLGRAKE